MFSNEIIKVFVLAQNYNDAAKWAQDNGIHKSRWTYVYDTTAMVGFPRGGHFVQLNGADKHPNHSYIMEEMIWRGHQEINQDHFKVKKSKKKAA